MFSLTGLMVLVVPQWERFNSRVGMNENWSLPSVVFQNFQPILTQRTRTFGSLGNNLQHPGTFVPGCIGREFTIATVTLLCGIFMTSILQFGPLVSR